MPICPGLGPGFGVGGNGLELQGVVVVVTGGWITRKTMMSTATARKQLATPAQQTVFEAKVEDCKQALAAVGRLKAGMAA